MKKRWITGILSLLCVGSVALGLAACKKEGSSDDWGRTFTYETAYAEARELGYSGTLEEFIATISGKDGANGKDGVGIVEVEIVTGKLLVTLTDGRQIDCGVVRTSDVCSHHYDEWSTGEGATCTSMGYDYRVCGECGDTEYRFTQALGHDYDMQTVGYESHSHTMTCKACKQMITSVHTFEEHYCTECNLLEGLVFELVSGATEYYVTAYGCQVEHLTFPARNYGLPVTRFEYMEDCDSVKKITLPEYVEGVGDWGEFLSGKGLTEYAVDENNPHLKAVDGDLYSKDGKTLYQCTLPDSVTSFTVPEGVETLGRGAFYSCNGLRSVTLPASLCSITLYAHEPSSLTEIIVDSENQTYQSIDGNLYSKDGTTLYRYMPGKTAAEFIVPKEVSRIYSYAFAKCEALQRVLFEDTEARWTYSPVGGASPEEWASYLKSSFSDVEKLINY